MKLSKPATFADKIAIVFSLLLLFFIYASITHVFTRYKVFIKNNAASTVDSVVITVNSKPVAIFKQLRCNDSAVVEYSTNGMNTQHDVFIMGLLYKDNERIDSFFDFNDLGYLSPEIKVVITDSLQLKSF